MNEALHRIAFAWLKKARHDLETARRMVKGTDQITNTAVLATVLYDFVRARLDAHQVQNAGPESSSPL